VRPQSGRRTKAQLIQFEIRDQSNRCHCTWPNGIPCPACCIFIVDTTSIQIRGKIRSEKQSNLHHHSGDLRGDADQKICSLEFISQNQPYFYSHGTVFFSHNKSVLQISRSSNKSLPNIAKYLGRAGCVQRDASNIKHWIPTTRRRRSYKRQGQWISSLERRNSFVLCHQTETRLPLKSGCRRFS